VELQKKQKMKRNPDYLMIARKVCQEKDCREKCFGIIKCKFLCESHYKDLKPSKERRFRYYWGQGLAGDKFKENLNL
jgi:hypothetical protein|tara:strand:+ start:5542 stop:5772 length:231 start_codon:yes stop_codon:yes gene_type:complete